MYVRDALNSDWQAHGFFKWAILKCGFHECFWESWLSGQNGKLSSYVGKEMVLGVRPEHLAVDKIAGQSDNSIKASVVVVEPLGDRKDVYLTTENGQKFIANLDPHIDIQMEQQVNMFIDINKAHIFKPTDTGENVSLS